MKLAFFGFCDSRSGSSVRGAFQSPLVERLVGSLGDDRGALRDEVADAAGSGRSGGAC